MTTEEAVELRQKLEMDMLRLLQAYRDATGLSPVSVSVGHHDVTQLSSNLRTIILTGVRITVEL